jgi:hypothetical protein
MTTLPLLYVGAIISVNSSLGTLYLDRHDPDMNPDMGFGHGPLNSVYKSGYLEFHFLALVYTSAKFIGIE